MSPPATLGPRRRKGAQRPAVSRRATLRWEPSSRPRLEDHRVMRSHGTCEWQKTDREPMAVACRVDKWLAAGGTQTRGHGLHIGMTCWLGEATTGLTDSGHQWSMSAWCGRRRLLSSGTVR
jgi:hypothetical protein